MFYKIVSLITYLLCFDKWHIDPANLGITLHGVHHMQGSGLTCTRGLYMSYYRIKFFRLYLLRLENWRIKRGYPIHAGVRIIYIYTYRLTLSPRNLHIWKGRILHVLPVVLWRLACRWITDSRSRRAPYIYNYVCMYIYACTYIYVYIHTYIYI